MADYAISSANLSAIERSLNDISKGIGTMNSSLDVIDNNVVQVNSHDKVVSDEVGALANEFHDF